MATPSATPALSDSDLAHYSRLAAGARFERDPLLLWQIRTARWDEDYIRVRSRSVADKSYLIDPRAGRHVGAGCYRSDTLRLECNHVRAARSFVEADRNDLVAHREFCNRYGYDVTGWNDHPPEESYA